MTAGGGVVGEKRLGPVFLREDTHAKSNYRREFVDAMWGRREKDGEGMRLAGLVEPL